ncbi:MAG: CarD family transcriptional regulator [Sphaerochaetaceae bacterium]|jgi:CarD family transcriptional regulator|nr:CarD family transcriptional regulator [Sphaerochaetaceae bacterium]MDD3163384.1 CarD family transcriptional regulator [Sphaerochaetaceae bacterium]MDD4007526.1 CarD family transcriptional regulator [Sphaerochaetaceae bacterium]
MKESKNELQFKIGEHVVYPLQGVGVITDIRTRKIHERDTLNYVIYLDISDMTVTIPVDKATIIGIRGIVGADEATKAIASIKEKFEPSTLDWKQRYIANVELVKEGSIGNVAKVVQALYHRSKVKELPVQERKLYENAMRLLIDEASFSLDKTTAQIKKMVDENLEK